MRIAGFVASVAMLVAVPAAQAQEQLVDPDFHASVTTPAYAADGPRVIIDESHDNFHTASGQYAPFAALLRADGYTVVPGRAAFDAGSLAGAKVLVIANAGSPRGQDTIRSAFTAAEIDAIDQWVRAGGSLLLIADHAPFGLAAEQLATRLGVRFGKGWAFERAKAGGLTSQIVYSRGNDRLGDHPILKGRSAGEAIGTVKSFTGQSLIGPPGSIALLRFPAEAWEAPDRALLDGSDAALRATKSSAPGMPKGVEAIGGRAQGVAFAHGTGRVVVLGEAGMLSAQLVRLGPGRPQLRIGMNVEGLDNRQFALNVMHWLSRALN
ncbi:DUF4350 domain-containing protein [Sphingomonas sp. BT-65]|uniref:DUF4350 domain-containing protein n=1 Tax=Sphingomonas sp. BT-65 TaxID=2989821 RepID=UPI0022366A39|nr:DUF4350 domain-containing protein [Sphingomonas sp. BT-65]MCW4460272.1 DUF4350 domain-containing protein [Sphingomonas sp. BT-65]